MQNQTSRKMGFLEKINAVIRDERGGSGSIAGMIKSNKPINFAEFKSAWEILFKRHPLLRATRRKEGKDYFFDFNANFSDVPIKHIEANDLEKVDQEYSRDIIENFNSNIYLWRATLITAQESQYSYVIFAAVHSICDGQSMTKLLGELLRTILTLRAGRHPDTMSYHVPLAIDEILDREKFSPPKAPTNSQTTTSLSFEKDASLNSICSNNLLYAMNPEDFTKLLANCRDHKTTITGALLAALTLAVFETHQQDRKEGVNLAITFSLQPYTKKGSSDQDFSNHADGISFHLDLATHDGFWGLAKQSKQKYKQCKHEYQFSAGDDHESSDDIGMMFEKKFDQKQFYIPYGVSNVGAVDSAFVGCEAFDIDSYYCTALNKAVIGLFLCVATLNNKLCVNFNFASPPMSSETAKKLADLTMKHLLDNIAT